jgi:hypothetical protein
MSLIRETFQPTIGRILLAAVLICALLVTQFGLTRHVVEHAAEPVATTAMIKDPVSTSGVANCLTCLEHQAHGSGLISHTITIAAQTIYAFEWQALATNTPYPTPKRANQRAPPALS